MMSTSIQKKDSNRPQALRALLRMGRVLLWIALTPIILISAGWMSPLPLGHDDRSYIPQWTSKEITARSLTICARFSDSVRQVREPQFHDEPFHNVSGSWRHRPVWTTLCEADGKRYYVEFNDRTGNLMDLVPEKGVMQFVAAESGGPFIKTSEEAASVARQRLVEMRLVPKGTRAELITAPESVANGRAWQMAWQVSPPAPAPTYEIKMVLARVGGVPIIVLDRSELAQYMVQ